jgi:hypothetical protein
LFELPDTIKPSWLNVPSLTVLSENASRTGIPDMSLTANKDPDRESVIENNWP